MRSLSALILFIAIFQLQGQLSKDYIIKLNKDTVFTRIVRIDKELKSIVCEENGKNHKYDATTILAFKYDTSFYEAGAARIKRKQHSIFWRRVIKGKLNLYEITIHKTQRSWKIIASDFIHLRWAYRAHDATKKVPVTIYAYRKENEPNADFSGSWKDKTKDCQLLLDKIKTEKWNPEPVELVLFYNSSCN